MGREEGQVVGRSKRENFQTDAFGALGPAVKLTYLHTYCAGSHSYHAELPVRQSEAEKIRASMGRQPHHNCLLHPILLYCTPMSRVWRLDSDELRYIIVWSQ